MPPDAHGPGFVKVVSVDSSPVQAPAIPHGHSHGCLFACEAHKGGGFNYPYFVSCCPSKTKHRAWPICVHSAGCLVIPLEFNLLVHFCRLSSSFSSLNAGSLCCSRLFISSVMVNNSVMCSTSPAALSALPTNSTNSSVNDDVFCSCSFYRIYELTMRNQINGFPNANNTWIQHSLSLSLA